MALITYSFISDSYILLPIDFWDCHGKKLQHKDCHGGNNLRHAHRSDGSLQLWIS